MLPLTTEINEMLLFSEAAVEIKSDEIDTFCLISSLRIPSNSLFIPIGPFGDILESIAKVVIYRWEKWSEGGFSSIPGSCGFEVYLAIAQRHPLLTDWMWEVSHLLFTPYEPYYPCTKHKWLTFRSLCTPTSLHFESHPSTLRTEVAAKPTSETLIWDPVLLKYVSHRLEMYREVLATVHQILRIDSILSR